MSSKANPNEKETRPIPEFMLNHPCNKCGSKSFIDYCPRCKRKLQIQLIKDINNKDQSILYPNPNFNLECRIRFQKNKLAVEISSTLIGSEIKRCNLNKPKSINQVRKFFRSFFPRSKFIVYAQACNLKHVSYSVMNKENHEDRVLIDNSINNIRLTKEEFENFCKIFCEIDPTWTVEMRNKHSIPNGEELFDILKNEDNRYMIQHNQNYKVIMNRIDKNIQTEAKFIDQIWKLAESFGYSINIKNDFKLNDEFNLDFTKIPGGNFDDRTDQRKGKNRNK